VALSLFICCHRVYVLHFCDLFIQITQLHHGALCLSVKGTD